MARTTPAGAIKMLEQHAYRREQAWITAITQGLIRARARAGSFWMPQASPTAEPRADKLSRRSGKLAATIRVVPPRKVGNDFLWGLTAGSPSVPYARIHEFGGRTRAHRIAPTRPGGVLRWGSGGRGGSPVFARFVNHPGSRIPARPYMQPAVREQIKSITSDFRSASRAITRAIFG